MWEGEVRLSSLFNRLSNQSDPYLLWVMFHRIYHIYHYIKIVDKVWSKNKLALTLPQYAPTIQTTLADHMKVPSVLHDVQIQPCHVFNYKKVGFYPNCNWLCIIFVYKWRNFSGMWCTQTGDNAPFWCKILILLWFNGQWFVPTLVIHQ